MPKKEKKGLYDELFKIPLNVFKAGEKPNTVKLNRPYYAIDELRQYVMRIALWCLINSIIATVALIISIIK